LPKSSKDISMVELNTDSFETVCICMPVLNEKEVIYDVVHEWIKVLDRLPSGSSILIEDGGSSDGTREMLESLAKEYPSIVVIYRDKPDGFGNAARRLLSSASAHWIFFTDSDGQYVAQDFWKLWSRRLGKDFVRGIKLGRQDPFFRRLASLIWNKSAKFLFELPVSDINAAFLLIRRDFLRTILPETRFLRTMVLSEIIIRSVYILHRRRMAGKSRATPGLKLLLVGIRQIRGLFQIKSDYRTSTWQV
jgi:dolichol-phosphate mannosyltransferase